MPFKEAENEAAFYGPKIDVQIWSIIGREFTLATNQLDFAVPERFNLTYSDKDGQEKTPLCIHRAPLSTHERFIGFLIEHFAGAFPLWLSPRQITIIPVADVFNNYGKEIYDILKRAGFRVELDDSSDSLGKKVRNAEQDKLNYALVIGEAEMQSRSVAVRNIRAKTQDVMSLEQFVKMASEEVKERKL